MHRLCIVCASLFVGSKDELSQLQGFNLELDLQEKLHRSGEGSVSY